LGIDTYFAKNFDGYSSVRDYQGELSTNTRIVIDPSRLEKKPPIGGLLMDYQRLVAYEADVLKMLVLVLDTRGAMPAAPHIERL